MGFCALSIGCVSDEAVTAAVRTDAWIWRPPGFECSSHAAWGQTSHLCVQKCIDLQNISIIIPGFRGAERK